MKVKNGFCSSRIEEDLGRCKDCPKEVVDFQEFDIDPSNDQNDQHTFYRRVCSKMIWLHLLGSLLTASENSLMAKKHLFCWQKPSGDYKYDGLAALFLVLESVNPST